MKILLLLTSQSVVDSDEAIVGLMALHIKRGISHPLFFYGQSYDAGAGVFAHAAALAFTVGGVSGVMLKVVAFAVWFGVALLAGYILLKCVGWRAAGYGLALMLWAPTSVEWAMKARGGYMLSLIFSLLTFASALSTRDTSASTRRKFANMLAIGMCGAAAVWAQPTSLPLVSMIVGWVAVEAVLERNLVFLAVIVGGAIIVSVVPMAFLNTANVSWSWQALGGGNGYRDPVLLFRSVLPAFFTPNLDTAYPPTALWISIVGVLWLIGVAGTCALAVRGHLLGIIPDHLRRPSGLLLATVGVAPVAFFMVGSLYARPRHILAFYPVACMIVSAVVDVWRQRTGKPWPLASIAVLLVCGVAVHVSSLGPPMIHGAGEQEWRQPAALIEEMTADLDRHQVQCVFSESPMLQWNLIFASNERITARWTAAQDRWPPYVERVNRAYAAGERCAVLIDNALGSDRITGLRSHFPDNVTVLNDRYALLYRVPSNITEVFR